MSKPRAIGIVRVSQLGDRDRDTFSSPKDQCDRMRELAAEQGWELTIPEPYEINVSGDSLLEDRPQLSRAVVAVQTGAADVICAAFTERLFWNHEVRAQLLRLVEAAGGEVWSADQGKLSNGSAADEFTGTVRTAADRFSRRQGAEKSYKGVARALREGRVTWRSTTPGYDLIEGRLVPNAEAPIVAEAFELRADGVPVREVRAFLAQHGIERSFHGVLTLLRSRVVLGELHFGSHQPNLAAHAPIVERELWERVQRVSVPRGVKARSERLLARLGVLRCASCGSRMVVGSSNNSTYWVYRCPPTGDCTNRVTISAPIAEEVVIDAARQALKGAVGVRKARQNVRAARLRLAQAQEQVDAFVDVFSASMDREKARERLAQLQAAVASAQRDVDRLDVPSDEDWIALLDEDFDSLKPFDQRRAIRAVIKAARVRRAESRGEDPAARIEIEPWGAVQALTGVSPPVPTDLT